MTSDPEQQQKQEFKSPQRKLVSFFEKSRNLWKSKFANAKKNLKRLENRVRFLEQGKAKWKEEAKRLKAQLTIVKKEVREQQPVSQDEPDQKKAPNHLS